MTLNFCPSERVGIIIIMFHGELILSLLGCCRLSKCNAICGSTHFAMMLALLVFATVLCSSSFVEGTVFLMPHFRTIPPNLIKVSYLFSLQP